MLSRYVQHPITGNLFPISSDIGKSILKEYLVNNTELMVGGTDISEAPMTDKDADKIASIALEGCPFLNLIRRDPTRFGTRRPKMAYQVIRHIGFSTTVAWNRHEFHDSLYCSVLVKTHHRDPESEGQMASCQLQSSLQLVGKRHECHILTS